MSGMYELAERVATNSTVFAVIITSYIWLTLICIVLLNAPEEYNAKEPLSWFDFFRSIVNGITIAAFFISVSELVKQYLTGQLLKTILLAAMSVGAFILTRKISKSEASEFFVRIIFYLLAIAGAIFGIITLIITLTHL